MRSFPVCTLASALLVLSLANCSNGEQTIQGYLKNTWGIEFSGFDGDFVVAADGTQSHSSTGKITVDGLGTNELSVESTVKHVAMGGENVLYISNLDGSQERYFSYDPTLDDIEIGSEQKGVAVGRQPDGTYVVWLYDGTNKEQEVAVPNGFEALRLVEQYNEFKSISPYILLTAFAFAHTQAPEARAYPAKTESCVPKSVCSTTTAAPPPVCALFKEFCDCAACLVLKRQGACGPCPKL